MSPFFETSKQLGLFRAEEQSQHTHLRNHCDANVFFPCKLVNKHAQVDQFVQDVRKHLSSINVVHMLFPCKNTDDLNNLRMT